MDVHNWIHTSDMEYTDNTVYSHTIKRVIDYEGVLYVATTDHTVHRWSGEVWEQIGETLPYEINDLTSYKGQLLVATYSATGDSILAWNGMLWVHFGPYLSGKVHVLLPYNETLYVGGDSEMGNLLYLAGHLIFVIMTLPLMSKLMAAKELHILAIDSHQLAKVVLEHLVMAVMAEIEVVVWMWTNILITV